MREEREPKPLGRLVQMLAAGRGWNERLAIGKLSESWAQVVGERVAGRCEPVSLFRGELTIRAEAGAWANELTLLGSTIARAVDEHLGGGMVRSVRVVAGRVGRAQPNPGGTGSSELS